MPSITCGSGVQILFPLTNGIAQLDRATEICGFESRHRNSGEAKWYSKALRMLQSKKSTASQKKVAKNKSCSCLRAAQAYDSLLLQQYGNKDLKEPSTLRGKSFGNVATR